MKLFPSYFRFRWWQLFLYEIALLSLGAGLAGIFPTFFQRWAPVFLFIFVVIGPYIFYLYLSQITRARDDGADSTSTLPDSDV